MLNRFFIIIFFISFSAFAEQKTDLLPYENYMNNIKYFKANFVQDDITNSQLSEGVFYLSRPGRLRIDYISPFEASLYSDNLTTIYYDKELDEASNIPTTTTPIQFLLKKDISFNNKDISVVAINGDDNFINISIVENKNKEQGVLTFVFKKEPVMLVGINVKNELGQEVVVEFSKPSTETIERKVFEFNNPRTRGVIAI